MKESFPMTNSPRPAEEPEQTIGLGQMMHEYPKLLRERNALRVSLDAATAARRHFEDAMHHAKRELRITKNQREFARDGWERDREARDRKEKALHQKIGALRETLLSVLFKHRHDSCTDCGEVPADDCEKCLGTGFEVE